MNTKVAAPLNFGKKLWLHVLAKVCNEANIDMEGIEYDHKFSDDKKYDVVAFRIPEFDVGVFMLNKSSFGLYYGGSALGLTAKQIYSKAWDAANLNATLIAAKNNIEGMAILLDFLSEGYKVLKAHRSEIENHNIDHAQCAEME